MKESVPDVLKPLLAFWVSTGRKQDKKQKKKKQDSKFQHADLESSVIHMACQLILSCVPSPNVGRMFPRVLDKITKLSKILTSRTSGRPTSSYIQEAGNTEDLDVCCSKVTMMLEKNPMPYIAGSLIGALESMFMGHPISSVRAIAVTAVKQLVLTNMDSLKQQEIEGSVWHMFFALVAPAYTVSEKSDLLYYGSNDQGDRRFIIDSLSELSHLFRTKEEICDRILESVYQMECKTSAEKVAIKKLLMLIGTEAAVCAQVHPKDDDSLDLVDWAAQTIGTNYPHLLEAHVLSPQPGVRYGAAVILCSFLSKYPEKLSLHADIITLGYCDSVVYVRILYMHLFRKFKSNLNDLVLSCEPPIELMERLVIGLNVKSEMVSIHTQESTLKFLALWTPRMQFISRLIIQELLNFLNSESALRLFAKNCLCNLVALCNRCAPEYLPLIWKQIAPPPSNLLIFFYLLPDLFPLVFQQILTTEDPKARIEIYMFLSVACKNEKITWAQGLLFFACGDCNQECIRVLSEIIAIQKPQFKETVDMILQCHKQRDYAKLLSVWIQLEALVSLDTTLLEWTQKTELIDFIWDFFLHNLPEPLVTLPIPDDLSYSNAFRHNVCWISILCSKQGLKPPVLSENDNRNICPSTSLVVRRRFDAGYMMCLIPMLGCPDTIHRTQACKAMFACCFAGAILKNSNASALFHFLPMLANHRSWGYAASALDIASLFIRAKTPMIAELMFHMYFALSLEFVVHSPHTQLRTRALNYIFCVLQVFPVACSLRLSEIRDALRSCCVDKTRIVASSARLLWPIVFRIASEKQVPYFLDYVQSEFDSTVENAEQKTVCVLMLKALAAINPRPQYSSRIISMATPFLWNNLTAFRIFSLSAVLHHIQNTNLAERNVLSWSCLPLSIEKSQAVAFTFDSLFAKQFFSSHLRVSDSFTFALSEHPDDAEILRVYPTGEIFSNTIAIANQNFSNALEPSAFDQALKTPISIFSFAQSYPDVPPDRLKSILSNQNAIGPVSKQDSLRVLINIDHLCSNKQVHKAAIAVLVEFLLQHDFCLEEITKMLIGMVCEDSKAAMDAVALIAQQSTGNFKFIFSHLGDHVEKNMRNPSQGVLKCINMLSLMAYEFDSAQVPRIVQLLQQALDVAFSNDTKMLLLSSLSDLVNEKKQGAVLDKFNQLIKENEDSPALFKMVHRLSLRFPPQNFPHEVYSGCANINATLLSGNPEQRLSTIWKMKCGVIPEEELMKAQLLLLSDENENVRLNAVKHFGDSVSRATLFTKVNICSLCKDLFSSAFLSLTEKDKSAHTIALIKELFSSATPDQRDSLLGIYIENLKSCVQNASRLRIAIFSDLDQSRFFNEDVVGFSFTPSNDSGVSADFQLQTFRKIIGDRQEHLEYLIYIASVILDIISSASFVDPSFLLDLLNDDNRTIRNSCISTFIKIPYPDKVYQETFGALMKRLETPLYYRKLDILQLLVSISEKTKIDNDALAKTFMKFWRDPIAKVRASSIDYIKRLKINKLALLEEATLLVSREDYPEKLKLGSLLSWLVQ